MDGTALLLLISLATSIATEEFSLPTMKGFCATKYPNTNEDPSSVNSRKVSTLAPIQSKKSFPYSHLRMSIPKMNWRLMAQMTCLQMTLRLCLEKMKPKRRMAAKPPADTSLAVKILSIDVKVFTYSPQDIYFRDLI